MCLSLCVDRFGKERVFVYTNGMENQMMIAVWIIALLISFVSMPLQYKIIGIIISIILIALYTYNAQRNNRLSKTNLVINLIVIGWDLSILYSALSSR